MRSSLTSRIRLLTAVPAVLVAACDPCFGTFACEAPQILYEGTVRSVQSGDGVAGVPVRYVREAGVVLERDTLAAVTDAAGRFRLHVPAEASGVVEGELFVRPSEATGYLSYASLPLVTTAVRGDVRYLEIRVSAPRLNHFGELYWRASREPAAGVAVEFRRTGGVQTAAAAVTSTSDAAGRFHIGVVAEEDGEVVGDVVLRPPPPYRSETRRGVRLQTLRLERELEYVGYWGLGLHISYVGELFYADTQAPAADVEVEFRRTGGIQLAVDTITTRTGPGGHFFLSAAPRGEAEGEVVGEMVVRPPPPYEVFTVPDVRLSTSTVDAETRFLGRWAVPRP